MKIRVVPTVLTNGLSQVKGEKFNNWRTVGTVMQAVRVHSARDVDELMLLDVNATKEGRLVDSRLVAEIAEFLRIPLTVGGGIKSLSDVHRLISSGADKVIVGSACAEVPGLIAELSKNFGSQAIVCAVDSSRDDRTRVAIRCGEWPLPVSVVDYVARLVDEGAGELLIQDISRDGTLAGMNHELIEKVADSVEVPLIASTGLSSPDDAVRAARAGASAVAAGAIFQFTETTPLKIKDALAAEGFDVRR